MERENDDKRSELLRRLHSAFIDRSQRDIILPNGSMGTWTYDFRPALLDGNMLDLICEVLWEHLSLELPCQIGGLETAAIALVSGLLMKAKENGRSITGFYAFDARSGERRWSFATKGPVRAGFALEERRGLLCFGSEDTYIYVLNAQTGEIVHKIETLEPVYSTPLIENDRLYFGLLDKRMLCVDLDTGKIAWSFWAHSRVFSTPALIDGRLYFGSNDGRLYELDATTGKEISYFQAAERIVNKIAYNPKTKHFFVPTYANEIYCLSKSE